MHGAVAAAARGRTDDPDHAGGLRSLRAAVARRATRAALTPKRREDLVLAVDELATNSIRHGGGAGTLTIWETSSALVCEVTDRGRLDPPARRPHAARARPDRPLPRGNLVRVWMRRG